MLLSVLSAFLPQPLVNMSTQLLHWMHLFPAEVLEGLTSSELELTNLLSSAQFEGTLLTELQMIEITEHNFFYSLGVHILVRLISALRDKCECNLSANCSFCMESIELSSGNTPPSASSVASEVFATVGSSSFLPYTADCVDKQHLNWLHSQLDQPSSQRQLIAKSTPFVPAQLDGVTSREKLLRKVCGTALATPLWPDPFTLSSANTPSVPPHWTMLGL